MVKAIIFDFTGVIYPGDYDQQLLGYIDQLRQKYKISMVSNLTAETYERLIVPIKEHFDDVVISSLVGVAKPDPEIYTLAAKRLGVEPNECVFIDDHDYRVEGALAAGMQGIVYESFDQMKTDLIKLLEWN